jgi:hypothetical protein
LDTKGVNVWCAAGKGTFGTEELIKRIQAADLASVIEHKTIILPQLGAVGVAAHQIKKATGFQVAYGPVRAEDLSEYLKNEMKASPDMRQVRFTLWDRLVLVPVELVTYFLPSLMAAVILLLVSTIHPTGIFFTFREAGEIFLNVFIAYLGGVALTPILLPWIPVRSFSGKGAISGLLLVAAMGLLRTPWLFIMPAISSFLAMNFTGSSTYTSLSGVKKEMKVAVPLQLAVIIMGAIGLIVSHFI